MPDLTETPQQKLDRWLPSIQPYLDELKKASPNFALVNYARSKYPFLDWVLSGKEPIEYFTPDPPEPPVVEIPWEIESPGIPKPDTSRTIADVWDLLIRMAKKMGGVL